ncbi:GSCFA family protein [Nitrosospira multiformis]|uniref:GSCFA family protein n=1 Tax=Nitrosospira multiformis TaxID=1231 RepID=A0A1H8NXZ4_9PROT|nr:GSCFA domain-containing protein [Nitrosospira multiformis]SEO34422.1 GSCFA family protein [Nitrosospira multiformis]
MKITVIGMSHIAALQHAWIKNPHLVNDARFQFIQLRRHEFGMENANYSPEDLADHHRSQLSREITEAANRADLIVLCIRGNILSVIGLTPLPGKVLNLTSSTISDDIQRLLHEDIEIDNKWLRFFSRCTTTTKVIIPPPPPIKSEEWIRAHPGALEERFKLYGIRPASYRLKLWRVYSQMLREQSLLNSTGFIDTPEAVLTDGYLKEIYGSPHPNHANAAYGEIMIHHIVQLIRTPNWITNISLSASRDSNGPEMDKVSLEKRNRQHPYQHLPDRAFWKKAVAETPSSQLDPVGEVKFKIKRSDKVATAGSCFAQHISKRICSMGFHFLVTENCISNDFYNFSARYGNIYTARQLVQLFDRAFGYFCPLDDHWLRSDGNFCDPFRPRIEPGGFESVERLVADRQCHLAAVREMFSQLDIFIFTLGLTECWMSRLDGAVFPIAPGVAGGEFDSMKYEFVNFGVNEIVSDLESFIRKLRLINPRAKLILTVSPVPLVATYEPTHVLAATTYSKSVLRVAADMVSCSYKEVYYFPSFEVITGNYNRGSYFSSDLRSVTEEGIDHVMTVFMRNLTEDSDVSLPQGGMTNTKSVYDKQMQEMVALAQTVCDEELLER